MSNPSILSSKESKSGYLHVGQVFSAGFLVKMKDVKPLFRAEPARAESNLNFFFCLARYKMVNFGNNPCRAGFFR